MSSNRSSFAAVMRSLLLGLVIVTSVTCAVPRAKHAEPSNVVNGNVATLAGNPSAQTSDGIGRAASFDRPTDIALGSNLNTLYVLEPQTPAIRVVSIDGVVRTLTRHLKDPTALAFNPLDLNLYTASASTSELDRVTTTDGHVSRFFQVPSAHDLPPEIISRFAIDRLGTFHITENRSGELFSVTAGKEFTERPVGPGIFGICVVGKDVYITNQLTGDLDKVGEFRLQRITSSSLLSFTTGISCDPDHSTFYVADEHQNRILKVTNGITAILAGNGVRGERDGSFQNAEFNRPTSVVYNAGNRTLYVVDSGGNSVRYLSGM
jgi:sugar lactone lactonase YvrE